MTKLQPTRRPAASTAGAAPSPSNGELWQAVSGGAPAGNSGPSASPADGGSVGEGVAASYRPTAGIRIAVAATGLGHVARGIEAWAQDLAAALHAHGQDVTLFRGAGPVQRPYETLIGCMRRGDRTTIRLVNWLPKRVVWRLGLGTTYGIEQTTFALNLLSHLRRGGYDLLHVQDAHLAKLIQYARRAKLVRTRVILGHGTNEPLASQHKIEFLQHLAPWHLEQAELNGVSRPAWCAIPNFVNVQEFRPGRGDDLRRQLGIPASALVVLTVAAVKRGHKRVHHLIEEFADARARRPGLDACLVIAGGRDPETDELVSLGRRLLGERVHFLLDLPRQHMPELYRAADLFAFCSLREMMPMALLEASASGLPCLVHDHPVLRWIVDPGGCIMDMGRSGPLAEAMGALLSDDGRRAALGSLARRHCVDHFSSEVVVGQMLDYYARVVAHQG